jgi:hypothetical protein
MRLGLLRFIALCVWVLPSMVLAQQARLPLVEPATAATEEPGAGVELSFDGGRVTLVATRVTVDKILAEWARLGDTRFIDAERLNGSPTTLQLIDVPEAAALRVLLRSVPGYVVMPRAVEASGTSRYDRVVILARRRIARTSPALVRVPDMPPADAVVPLSQAPAQVSTVAQTPPAPDLFSIPPDPFLAGSPAVPGRAPQAPASGAFPGTPGAAGLTTAALPGMIPEVPEGTLTPEERLLLEAGIPNFDFLQRPPQP